MLWKGRWRFVEVKSDELKYRSFLEVYSVAAKCIISNEDSPSLCIGVVFCICKKKTFHYTLRTTFYHNDFLVFLRFWVFFIFGGREVKGQAELSDYNVHFNEQLL